MTALPIRRAVFFRTCVMSVASAESRWFILELGPFTLHVCAVLAASPLQLITLPHRMISDALCSVHHRVNLLAAEIRQVSVLLER